MAPLEIKLHPEIDKKWRFEMLLNEISTFFINLPIDRIDSEIETAQSRVCEFLGLDRSTLFQMSEGEEQMRLTHLYQPSEIPKPSERMSAIDFFPWAVQKILGGEIITISKMTDLPEEACIDLKSFNHYRTKSAVVIPLSVERGKIFGLLTFSVTREQREWTEKAVQQFKAVAQIFANVLARKHTSQALHENETRLNLVTDTAGAGLWILEIDTGDVWVTTKTRKLFHFAPNEDLNYESFFKVMHSDDHEQVQQAVQKAIQSGEDLECEYRILLPDKSIRWILVRGKRHLSPTGMSERLMGVSLDITERKQSEQVLEARLRFETLLTEVSTCFINKPSHRIDQEIEETQRYICEFLDLDFVALWQYPPETQNILTLTHLYSTQKDLQVPKQLKLIENFPWVLQQMQAGRSLCISSLEDLPPEAALDHEASRLLGIKSSLTLPLSVGEDQFVGVLALNTTQAERDWPEAQVKQLKLVAQIFANALERKRMDGQLREHIREIEKLKQRLEKENIYLKQEVNLLEHKEIVGQSLVMKRILNLSEQVAQTESTVLIQGETGTGKGLLAREIHKMSSRKDRHMVTINCAALPAALIEGELFGREKGAYTGALTKMAGRFEVADGATIFLDEIGELPHEVQSKLLQVLEHGRLERLGSTKPLHVNVRIIAATNRDLAQSVKEGKFRKDLYYRLNVFPILIPPLRERREDIPLMVWAFFKEFQKKMMRNAESIPKKTLEVLQSYDWPGNVRELRNVIEHAMILNTDKNLVISVPRAEFFETQAASRLDDVERRHIVSILERTGWRVAGKGGAAEALGVRRTTLHSKMKKLGIDRPSIE